MPARYKVLPDSTVDEIASKLERGGRSTERLIRIADEQKEILHISDGFEADNALGRILYLETMKDVSDVFTERAMGFSVYRQMTIAILLLGTVIMHFISSLLTKPIRLLTKATKRMTGGDYAYRARQVSNDELGQLTCDFNKMANVLEQNIEMLEDENEAKEEFMGAFAHELKTPLTAIIGYADMLRSHKLDEEKSILPIIFTQRENDLRRCPFGC